MGLNTYALTLSLLVGCQAKQIIPYMRVGHSVEYLTSESGHPMYVDEVASDFPWLTFVLTHTSCPWIDEWVSMLWGQPNVYSNIGAYSPSGLDASLVRFTDRLRG